MVSKQYADEVIWVHHGPTTHPLIKAWSCDYCRQVKDEFDKQFGNLDELTQSEIQEKIDGEAP